MKRSIFIGVIMFVSFACNAQIKKESDSTISQSGKEMGEDIVYNFVQQKPKFTGGEEAMVQYIKENLKYPATTAAEKKGGQVVLRFIVSRDSTIRDIKVLRGFDSAFDEEAVRLVKEMPKWSPGRHNGKAVSCSYTLPIKF